MSWDSDDGDEDPAELLGDIYDDTMKDLLVVQHFGERLRIPDIMDLWLWDDRVSPDASSGAVVIMDGDDEIGRVELRLEHVVATDGIHLRLDAIHVKRPLDVSQIAALTDAVDFAYRRVMRGPDDSAT